MTRFSELSPGAQWLEWQENRAKHGVDEYEAGTERERRYQRYFEQLEDIDNDEDSVASEEVDDDAMDLIQVAGTNSNFADCPVLLAEESGDSFNIEDEEFHESWNRADIIVYKRQKTN